MQAKHGFAVLRLRGRLMIVCAIAVAAMSAMVLAPAANAVNAPQTDALGLGDSLAFGYTQEKFELNAPLEPVSAFEEGYVHFFDHKLRASSKKLGEMLQGLVEINNGCPEETTDSMIGNGALATAFGIPGEAPCGYHNVKGYPLHHEYGGPGVSQLENAIGVIATAPDLEAITLNIGSNDELKAVAKCKKEVKEEFELEGKSKYGKTEQGALATCVGAHANELFGHIIKNIGRIVFAIDHGASFGGVNYTGAIVLMGFYNPQSFILPGSDALQKALNDSIIATFFTPMRCNPSHKAPPCEEGETEEANPNFVPNMTYANPFTKINVPKPSNEQANICKYTEECNEFDKHQNLVHKYEKEGFTQAEAEAKATPEASKEYPEGDIHPTKLGYELLGKMAFSSYLANPAKT